MAENTIQFQNGLNLTSSLDRYGTELRCRETPITLRWPHGFVCPHCSNTTYFELNNRPLFQCHRCDHQTSLTAGTIFAGSKLPLTAWFLTIFRLTQYKKRISARALSGELGVQYETARSMKHKFTPNCTIWSGGLVCFAGVTQAQCRHIPMVTGGGRKSAQSPAFRWVNIVLGNLKNSLRGTYHAISAQCTARYLAEFEYRFNRRFDLPAMIERLAYVAVRTPPLPNRFITIAEAHG